LLRAIDQLVTAEQEYKIGYPQFINRPVTRAGQVDDAAAILNGRTTCGT